MTLEASHGNAAGNSSHVHYVGYHLISTCSFVFFLRADPCRGQSRLWRRTRRAGGKLRRSICQNFRHPTVMRAIDSFRQARVDCLVMHCGLALVRDRIGEGQAVRALAIKGGPRLGTNSSLNKSTPVSFTASSAISHHVQISAILRRCSPSLPIDQVSNKQRS